MESNKGKYVLSKMYMVFVSVVMLLKTTSGQSTHNSIVLESSKGDSENNESAIHAELTNLREEIFKLSLNLTERMNKQQQILNDESSARKKQDSELQSLIEAETSARTKQDNELQSLIGNETSERKEQDNELQSLVKFETSARTEQDNELQSLIGNETSARMEQDNELQSLIGNETSARKEQDNELQSLIETETSARKKQDNELQSQIDDEISARNEQDNALQSRIDAINAKPRFAAEVRPSSDNYYLPKGWITDFTELIDVNNNFDPVTGAFTLNEDDEDGVYIFAVSAYKSRVNGNKGLVAFYKNNKYVRQIFEADTDNALTMNIVFALHLQKGDEVRLENFYARSIYSGSHPFTFTGYKI